MRRTITTIAILTMLVGIGCKSNLTRSKSQAMIVEYLDNRGGHPSAHGLERVGKFGGTHPSFTEEGAACSFDPDNQFSFSAYSVLQQLGYVEIKTTGAKSYLVSLTDRANKLMADQHEAPIAHAKYGECETDLVDLLIARADFDKVTGITGDGESFRTVEFHMKWVLTPLGQALFADNSPFWKVPADRRKDMFTGLPKLADMDNSPDAVRRIIERGKDGAAPFQKYDDGWRIKE